MKNNVSINNFLIKIVKRIIFYMFPFFSPFKKIYNKYYVYLYMFIEIMDFCFYRTKTIIF